MSRASSRSNKRQFTSIKFKTYTPKPALKQPKPPAPLPLPSAPAAYVAIPAILFDSPNSDDINEN
jgi:hypothetical protein